MGSLTSRAHLSAPAAIGAGIVFRRLAVRLAPSTTITRRQPHPRLRAPAQIGAGIVFRPVVSRVVATRSRALRPKIVRPGDSGYSTKVAQTGVGLF